MTKKTEVTIESREIWVIHRRPAAAATQQHSHEQAPTQAHCQGCAAWVEWLTPEETAALTGQSLRQIFRHIENAAVHFRETAVGGILLCLPSVAASHKPDRQELAAPP